MTLTTLIRFFSTGIDRRDDPNHGQNSYEGGHILSVQEQGGEEFGHVWLEDDR
ncbi:hypothetical protein [Halocatena marina]|uniref:hypothetical protein n=1 Tax=Halocatena marina TaxID=2934937 RepID=UPI00200BB9EC|nr:hypothetical protein [Halocatena marina]